MTKSTARIVSIVGLAAMLAALFVLCTVPEAKGEQLSPAIYTAAASRQLTSDGDTLVGAGGIQRWKRKAAVSDKVTVLHHTGDGPAVQMSGDGCYLRGLNIWRCYYGDGSPLLHTGTGLEVSQWGKHLVRHLGFAGWDTAIQFIPSNHCDESKFDCIHTNSCRITVKCDEPQSSGCKFEELYVYGKGDYVFDLAKGGNYEIGTLVVNEPRTIFRLRETSSNTCTFIVHNLKVDNNAAGWKLLEMVKPGPINLTVRGHIGQQAKMGDRPIVIPDAKTPRFDPPNDYQVLDVELWGPNPNPERGALWQPTLEECRP